MGAFLLLVLLGTAQAAGPALIELYTSEGCNSCPRADAWLARLIDHRGLWRDFVPVGFHVSYWDYLGWKDPFAKASYVERQRRLAVSDRVYTPGLFLNAKEWRGWGGAAPRAAAGPRRLSVRSRGRFSHEASFKGSGTVHAVLLGFGLESAVRAGENAGRRLRHEFVALDHVERPLVDGKAAIALNAPRGLSPSRYGLAVWVEGKDGQPLEAWGSWLP